jgi:hypothetical protein
LKRAVTAAGRARQGRRDMASRQKIKTFLWFDKEAEEAAR